MNASESDARKDPDLLEREIDEQRREINETLRALEEKFSSREIASQFVHYFGGPGREWAGNLGSSVKANPIPSLLTAIGVAWLMMGERNGTYRAASSYAAADHEGRGKFSEARSSLHNAADSIRHKASELGDKASDASDALGERAAHTRESLRSHASHAREGLGHSAHDMRDSVEQLAREQPLALGAVGIALGAIIGAILPRTESENRLFGRASKRMREQGKEMAREGYDKASEKAAEVVEVAGETLQRDASQVGANPSL